jgi:hypothetical protein
MTIKSYINKVLKDKKQKPIPKNTNLIGNNYFKVAFESVGERVLQLKKDKSLTKDETEILLLAINKAIDHGSLLDKYDDIDQRILSAKEMTAPFKSFGERVLQLEKDKSLTKDEDDIDQIVLSAQKISRKGRSRSNLSAALDLITEREKGTKPAKRDWHRIADDYGVLTEDRKPWEAIKELAGRYKFPSEQALIRGLKRFKKETSYSVFIEALGTLPWLDEPDE